MDSWGPPQSQQQLCYGDTGRMSLALSVLPQCVSNSMRAAQATDENVNTLLYHTFCEQRQLKPGRTLQTRAVILGRIFPPQTLQKSFCRHIHYIYTLEGRTSAPTKDVLLLSI